MAVVRVVERKGAKVKKANGGAAVDRRRQNGDIPRPKHGGVIKAPTIRHSERDAKKFVPFEAPVFTPKKKKTTKKGAKTEKIVAKPGKTGKKKGKKIDAKVKKEKEKKAVKVKKAALKGNDRLTPRPLIAVPRENPLLFGKKAEEYMNWRSLYRRLIWAICKQDLKEVKTILDDKRLAYGTASHCFSFMDHRCAVVEAVASGNAKLWQLVLSRLHDIYGDEHRSDVREANLLDRKSTGRRNWYMLGRATRNIESVRGGREGNNAFLNYEAQAVDGGCVIRQLLERGVDYGTLKTIVAKRDNYCTPSITLSYNTFEYKVVEMVRLGQRKLASAVATEFKQYFNQLHLETLKEGGRLPSRILAISVRKKAFGNREMSPAHTAAINPDPKFLSALRDVDPVINHSDQDNWYTMHYAAVCEGDGPLKFLLSKDIGVLDMTKKGETTLHVAARAGRHKNVKILLDAIAKLENQPRKEENRAEAEEEEEGPRKKKKRMEVVEEEEPAPVAVKGKKAEKGPTSMVNAKTRYGMTALHLAAKFARTETVRVLLGSERVDKEAKTSPNQKSMTALMLAVGYGHLETAEILIEKGCLIEARDKLKRTPLMIAVMNGQAHIVADLLKKGADVLKKDSSSNTAMHYACAYGWIECAKMLVEVDASTVTAANDWLLTPLSVAYLKGHYGVVSWLLDGPHASLVDINCKDNNGVTLISSLIGYHDESSTQHLPLQIDFLIENGASCNILDTDGNSPLHMLAAVPMLLKMPATEGRTPPKNNDTRLNSKEYKECVRKLLDAGASITQSSVSGRTPFRVALEAGNLFLAEHFFDQVGSKLLEEEISREGSFPDGSNLFHVLFNLPFLILGKKDIWAYDNSPAGGQYRVLPLFNKMLDKLGDRAKAWLLQSNGEGTSPVLQLASSLLSSAPRLYGDRSPLAPLAVSLQQLLKRALIFCPHAVLARKELSDEEKGKMSEKEQLSVPCLLKIALDSGRDKGNELLDAVVEAASSATLLPSLFSLRFYNSELPTSALLYALTEKKKYEATLLLNASKKAGLASTVHSAQFDTRFDEKKKEMIAWEKTALMVAVDGELAELLPHFQLTPQQAAKTDANGWTACHYAATKLTPTTSSLFEGLQRLGVPLDKTTLEGLTPLHVAVNAESTGSADAFLDPVDWLLSKINPTLKDKKGRSALHYAFEKMGESEVRKQDPIAVVSLLLGKLKKEEICSVDLAGNTALHLAAKADANICAVTLLGKGAQVDAINSEGNTPLALALFHKSLATSLTLIQAHAAITGTVYGPIPEKNKKEDEVWRFAATPVDSSERFESPIPSVVVRNEWHSLVYVMLDLLGKTEATVSRLVAAALQNGQHNFAIYLLKLLGKQTPAVSTAIGQHNLFMLYTNSLPKGDVSGPAKTVLEMLFALGVSFNASIVEAAISRGCFHLLTLFKEHNLSAWQAIAPTAPGVSVLRELLARWIAHPTEEKHLRPLLDDFRSFAVFSLDAVVDAPKPALPGLAPPLEPRVHDKVTPLTWAVQAHCPSLILYLLSAGVDVNRGEAAPLLHAIATNNYSLIKVLLDGEMPEKEEKQTAGQNKKKNVVQTMVFGKMTYVQHFQNGEEGSDEEEDDEEKSDSGSDSDAAEKEDAMEEEEEQIKEIKQQTINLLYKNKKVNLTVTDCIGRNLCHYLVEPCGYQNVALLRAFTGLVKAPEMKRLLTSPDRSSEKMTPLQLAAARGQWQMHAEMSKIAGEKTAAAPLPFSSPSPSPYNAVADAEKFCAEWEKKKADKAVEKKDERIPDKKTGYEKTGRIVFCEETQQLFKILLNKTDLRAGTYGFHNYYIMELIKRKDSVLFILFTNWGRIGDARGEFQCTPFNSLPAALKEWKSIWRQKTGNEWGPMKEFEEKRGKYRLVKTEDRVGSLADIDIDPFVLSETDKKDDVMRFFADISNYKMLKSYAKQVNIQGRNYACPFGRVSREDIRKAKEIIAQLQINIDEQNKLYATTTTGGVDTEKLLSLLDQQRELTSSFYTTVPLGGFERTALGVIGNQEELNQAEQVLSQLTEIETAGRLMAAAALNRSTVDPIRYICSAVECPVKPLPPSADFSQRILQWIRASQATAKVCGLFEIRPRSAALQFERHSSCPNTTFLVHGTRAENLLSILHNSLAATPSNALQCGQMHGKGVYLADSFAKSASYCSPSRSELNYMIVCKVALGKVWDAGVNRTEASRFDTLIAYGQCYPNPEGNITVDGAAMPCGPLVRGQQGVSRGWYEWNEYIVKDSARILPSHLIIFKS